MGSSKSTAKPKMATDIPPGIETPDQIVTRIGTLNFQDGFPTENTAALVYDHLDFQRAVHAMMSTTQGASLVAFRRGLRELGPDNETLVISEGRMDCKPLLLTPNTTVVYGFMWMDLKEGPMVIEAPPAVLGIVDNFWFKYVSDIGMAGEDKGAGGKYLFLPPDSDIKPAGFFVRKSQTYGNWFVIRGFMPHGLDPSAVLNNWKDGLRVYRYGASPRVPDMVNMVGKEVNTVHRSDAGYFDELNELVQEEPNAAGDPEILGVLQTLGIEKGKSFKPDARMQKILTDAAAVGTAACRTMIFRNREDFAAYPGSKTWETGFPAGSYEFLRDGVRLIDQRLRFHYFATGITPAMIVEMVGVGSQYMMGIRDSNGQRLDGSKAYKLNLPPNVPAKLFWEITLYDNQTRSELQTDNPYPAITSLMDVLFNPDGSCDVFFGPDEPEGKKNWIQTVPGKGWNMLWRLYGPLKPWFEKTWRPGEIMLL